MRKRRILIRFDDICPTMNYEQFNRALDILRKYDIKPLLGIIPDCQDPKLNIDEENRDFWSWIKDLQNEGYTLAMHGYQHVYDSKKRGLVDIRFQSEFVGHSLEEQCEKIRKGKAVLNSYGIYTDIFFAPSHSYDNNTLKALKINGFRYLSDGMSRKSRVINGVMCIPCRNGGCFRIGRNGIYTAVFHTNSWLDSNSLVGYDYLVYLCEKYAKDIVNFKELENSGVGNAFVQEIDEKLYVFYFRYIRPILSKIKHIIK